MCIGLGFVGLLVYLFYSTLVSYYKRNLLSITKKATSKSKKGKELVKNF